MSYKILIIDDESKVFETYKEILGEYTILEIEYRSNGPDALTAIQDHEPSLIMLDQIFYAHNIGAEKLYFLDMNENEERISLVPPDEDHENLVEVEKEQGLYILKMIRQSGFSIPIVFMTQYPDDGPWDEARQCGAQDYLSKERLNRELLVPKIENFLKIKLISIKDEVNAILDSKGTPSGEKKLLVPRLVKEAQKKRRRGAAFVREVGGRLENAPSISALERTISETLAEPFWETEPVSRQELLRCALERMNCDGKGKLLEHEFKFISQNALRYKYQFQCATKYFLSVVRPEFSEAQPSGEVKAFELNEKDPDWKGSFVSYYREAITCSQTLNDYLKKNAPLSPEIIKTILENLTGCLLKEFSSGHGMLEMDSIHVDDNNMVFITDRQLWDGVTQEGRKHIKWLNQCDRKKRDIQALGRAADLLLTGCPGELENDTNDRFYNFISKCSSGEWSLDTEIPAPPTSLRFFHFGGFRSELEENFFYQLKSTLLRHKLNALVAMNPKTKINKLGLMEADLIILLNKKGFWVDIKGASYKKIMTIQKPKIVHIFSPLQMN